MAYCVAIFNKEDVLLLLKMKEKISDPELISEVQRFLYNSYDIIIDKINNPPGKTTQEPFLGSLLLNNSYRSFGYITNSGIKFALVTEAENTMLKDHEIRLFFKKLHSEYCSALSNPFYTIGTPIKSKHVHKVIQDFFNCF